MDKWTRGQPTRLGRHRLGHSGKLEVDNDERTGYKAVYGRTVQLPS